MGTTTGSSNVIDYTVDIAAVVTQLTRIAVAAENIQSSLTNISNRQTQMATATDQIRDDVDAIRQSAATFTTTHGNILSKHTEFVNRAVNELQGIFIDDVNTPETRLSRASIIHALRQTDQLDDVLAEMANPTPIG